MLSLLFLYLLCEGVVSMWDTSQNTCIMFWKTGTCEIGKNIFQEITSLMCIFRSVSSS